MKRLALPSVLKDRNFVLLMSGQTVAAFGNNIYTLALLWMMQVETKGQPDATLLLGLVLMAGLLPSVFLAPIAGVLVDRWPKRVTMLVTDYIRGVLLVLLTVLTLLHDTSPWELIAFNLVLASAGTAFRPATVVLTKELVSGERLMSANSVQNIGQKTMELAGPAAGGLLIGLFGLGPVFAVNAATFFVSAISLTLLSAPEPDLRRGSLAPSALYGDIREGIGVYLSNPYTRALTPFILLYNFGISAIEFLIVRYVAVTLHDPSNHGALLVGIFNTCMAVGELLGGFFVPYFSRVWSKERLPVVCMSFTGLCVIGIGLTRLPWVIGILFFISGFFMILSNTVYFTSVQTEVPSDALGRVYALLGALFLGVMPLSQLAFGAVAAFVPVTDLVYASGSVAFLGISAAWLNPVVRHPAPPNLPNVEEIVS